MPQKPNSWRDGSLPRATSRDIYLKPDSQFKLAPSWDALENQVLRFYGFWQEQVDERNDENQRYRRIVLYYYLEDDTIQVIEPRVDNSGIWQGTLIRRHRIPLDSHDLSYIGPSNLHVGGSVPLYGKVCQLTDCDPFTRDWYESNGYPPQPDALETPDDGVSLKRITTETKIPIPPMTYEKRYREIMLGGGHLNENMQQFMEMDGKVCRFYAILDDMNTPQFERRPFIVHFFLSDDTIELREMYPRNCGRQEFAVFYHRSKLPRVTSGKDANLTGSRLLHGPMDSALRRKDFIQLGDLAVGKVLKVLDQELLIHDADLFTRHFYKEQLGIELEDALDVSLPKKPFGSQPIPPYTGYGTEEDSMASVLNLIPKVPKKDVKRLFANEGKLLRFTAKLANPRPEDKIREFIVTFYLKDGHVMVHEPPIRNSGVIGGRFIQKGRYLNQNTNKWFEEDDFNVIGLKDCKVVIAGNALALTGWDDYTRKYYEKTPHVYPSHDLKSVVERLREACRIQSEKFLNVFRQFDKDFNGVLTLAEFQWAMSKFGMELNKEEALACMRHFDQNEDGVVTYNEFADVLLDRDALTSLGDTHALRRVRVEPDPNYENRAELRILQLKEAEAVRLSVRRIQEYIYTRPKSSTRLLKEFVKMTSGRHVTCAQILKALNDLGSDCSQEDVERTVAFLCPGSPFDKVEYVDFVQALSITFHDLHHDRGI